MRFYLHSILHFFFLDPPKAQLGIIRIIKLYLNSVYILGLHSKSAVQLLNVYLIAYHYAVRLNVTVHTRVVLLSKYLSSYVGRRSK